MWTVTNSQGSDLEIGKSNKNIFRLKQKRHTFKSQVVSLPLAKDIVDVIVGEKGPTSDISLFRNQRAKFAPAQSFQGDKAYIGDKNISTPHKKPRKRELTSEQKAENKVFSGQRVFVEHLIRIIKIFRIDLKDFDFILGYMSK